jgi:hypothetical protein
LICLWSCFHHNMTEHGVRSRCNQSSAQHSASVTAVPETVTCCSFCITCTRHIVLTHIPAWQTCAVAPVPASQPRHVSGLNEGSKTFVTDGSSVRHVGTRHTHPPGLRWGVLITANQYRFFALEVRFDTTILVGSLTAGSVCAEEKRTGNRVSERSIWRWPRGGCLKMEGV